MSPTPDPPRRTLALLLGALGDTILTLPALDALARSGSGPLTLWGPEPERLGLLTAPRGPAAHARRWPAACAALWGADPLPLELSAQLAGFERVIGFLDGPGAARWASQVGALIVPPPRPGELRAHAGDALAERFATATGLGAPGPPSLRPTPADRARGHALAGVAEDYLVCHPGSGGREKRWPAARWAELLALLPWPVVVVTGTVEQDWEVLDLGRLTRGRVTLGPTSLEDLLALLAGARAFLGHDSGPAHLAAALGTPTLAVFGPTDPSHWGPRGRGRVEVVRRDPLAALDVGSVRAAWARLLL